MRLNLLLTISLLILLLTSCSMYSGYITSNYNGPLPETVKSYTGTASANYVFGIGGQMHQGLVQKAKEDLYQKVRMFDSPRLINYTVDIKKSYYFIYSKTQVFVSAELLNYDNIDDGVREKVVKDEQNKTFGFYIGERVKYKMLGKEKIGKIIKLKKKTALIQSQDLLKREWVSFRFIEKLEKSQTKSDKLTF